MLRNPQASFVHPGVSAYGKSRQQASSLKNFLIITTFHLDQKAQNLEQYHLPLSDIFSVKIEFIVVANIIAKIEPIKYFNFNLYLNRKDFPQRKVLDLYCFL